MHHVAIMKKSWQLIPKILSNEKTIESRWYKNRAAPWDRVQVGDTIWFKNSGELVTAQARVGKVLQFQDFTANEVRGLYRKYGEAIGVPKEKHAQWAKSKIGTRKHYCILMFLEKPRKVQPFGINKTGFGNATAWLCVSNIANIQVR